MPKPIQLSTTVVRGEGHLHAELSSEETVVLGADLEHYFGLNSVAARVWQLVETPMTVSAICSVLLAEFEVDRPTCESQVLELIGRLAQESLVRVGDEAM
jgi:hypothetical protein